LKYSSSNGAGKRGLWDNSSAEGLLSGSCWRSQIITAIGKTSMVAQADKNVNVHTLSLSVSMWIPARWENNGRLSQVLKDRDSFGARVELEVHLEEYNLGMRSLRYWITWDKGGRNALQDCTCLLLNGLEVLVLSVSIVPQERYTTLFQPLQIMSKYWGEKHSEANEPRVISASRVIDGEATSEGSTAARLEVANPKSPTSNEKKSQKYQ